MVKRRCHRPVSGDGGGCVRFDCSAWWQSFLACRFAANGMGTRVRPEKTIMGELVRAETVSAVMLRESGATVPAELESVTRYLVKVGNRDVYGRDFSWYMDYEISGWTVPEGAIALERRERGNFYGFPLKLTEGDKLIAEGVAMWPELMQRVERANAIFQQMKDIEKMTSAVSTIRLRSCV